MRPATLEQKARELLRLQKIAEARGYQKGWVAHRYKESFGVWPRLSPEALEGFTPAEKPYVPEVLP